MYIHTPMFETAHTFRIESKKIMLHSLFKGKERLQFHATERNCQIPFFLLCGNYEMRLYL